MAVRMSSNVISAWNKNRDELKAAAENIDLDPEYLEKLITKE